MQQNNRNPFVNPNNRHFRPDGPMPCDSRNQGNFFSNLAPWQRENNSSSLFGNKLFSSSTAGNSNVENSYSTGGLEGCFPRKENPRLDSDSRAHSSGGNMFGSSFWNRDVSDRAKSHTDSSISSNSSQSKPASEISNESRNSNSNTQLGNTQIRPLIQGGNSNSNTVLGNTQIKPLIQSGNSSSNTLPGNTQIRPLIQSANLNRSSGFKPSSSLTLTSKNRLDTSRSNDEKTREFGRDNNWRPDFKHGSLMASAGADRNCKNFSSNNNSNSRNDSVLGSAKRKSSCEIDQNSVKKPRLDVTTSSQSMQSLVEQSKSVENLGSGNFKKDTKKFQNKHQIFSKGKGPMNIPAGLDFIPLGSKTASSSNSTNVNSVSKNNSNDKVVLISHKPLSESSNGRAISENSKPSASTVKNSVSLQRSPIRVNYLSSIKDKNFDSTLKLLNKTNLTRKTSPSKIPLSAPVSSETGAVLRPDLLRNISAPRSRRDLLQLNMLVRAHSTAPRARVRGSSQSGDDTSDEAHVIGESFTGVDPSTDPIEINDNDEVEGGNFLVTEDMISGALCIDDDDVNTSSSVEGLTVTESMISEKSASKNLSEENINSKNSPQILKNTSTTSSFSNGLSDDNVNYNNSFQLLKYISTNSKSSSTKTFSFGKPSTTAASTDSTAAFTVTTSSNMPTFSNSNISLDAVSSGGKTKRNKKRKKHKHENWNDFPEANANATDKEKKKHMHENRNTVEETNAKANTNVNTNANDNSSGKKKKKHMHENRNTVAEANAKANTNANTNANDNFTSKKKNKHKHENRHTVEEADGKANSNAHNANANAITTSSATSHEPGNEIAAARSTADDDLSNSTDLNSSFDHGVSDVILQDPMGELQKLLHVDEKVYNKLQNVESEIESVENTMKEMFNKLTELKEIRKKLVYKQTKQRKKTMKIIKVLHSDMQVPFFRGMSSASASSTTDSSIITAADIATVSSSCSSSTQQCVTVTDNFGMATVMAASESRMSTGIFSAALRSDVDRNKSLNGCGSEAFLNNLQNNIAGSNSSYASNFNAELISSSSGTAAVMSSSSFTTRANILENISSSVIDALVAGTEAIAKINPNKISDLGAADGMNSMMSAAVSYHSDADSLSQSNTNSNLMNTYTGADASDRLLNSRGEIGEEMINLSNVISIEPIMYDCDIDQPCIDTDFSRLSAEFPSNESANSEFRNTEASASLVAQQKIFMNEPLNQDQPNEVIQPISVLSSSKNKKSFSGKHQSVNLDNGITIELSVLNERAKRKKDKTSLQNNEELNDSSDLEAEKISLRRESNPVEEISNIGETSNNSSVVVRNLSESRSDEEWKQSILAPGNINKSNTRLFLSALSNSLSKSAPGGFKALRKVLNTGARLPSDGAPGPRHFQPYLPHVKRNSESSSSAAAAKQIPDAVIPDAASENFRITHENDNMLSGICDNVGASSSNGAHHRDERFSSYLGNIVMQGQGQGPSQIPQPPVRIEELIGSPLFMCKREYDVLAGLDCISSSGAESSAVQGIVNEVTGDNNADRTNGI